MSLNIKFWLNGQKYRINEQIRLYDLIKYFRYSNTLLVLEHNKVTYNKNLWKEILVSDLDKIEIVTIVGGG